MDHLISETIINPFKIPPPPPTVLISDKSLIALLQTRNRKLVHMLGRQQQLNKRNP